jgi:hypothetical protein
LGLRKFSPVYIYSIEPNGLLSLFRQNCNI